MTLGDEWKDVELEGAAVVVVVEKKHLNGDEGELVKLFPILKEASLT